MSPTTPSTMERAEGRSGSAATRIPERIARSPERWLKKLRRWKSMPTSRLTPSDRALYSCRGCASINTHGIICTWCGRACDRVPGAEGVRRRVSAPHLLNDAQKEQLRRIERSTAATVHVSTGNPLVLLAKEMKAVRRRRHRDAVVYSLDGETGLVRTNRETSFFVRSSIYPSVEGTARSGTVDSLLSDSSPIEEGNVLPTSNAPHSLRRRKRFSLPKRQSSSSIRSKSPHPKEEIVAQTLTKKVDEPPKTPVRATVGPTPPASPARSVASSRTGRPSGPIYGAIRRSFNVDRTTVLSVSSLRSISPCEPRTAAPAERSTSPHFPFFSSDEETDDSSPGIGSSYAHFHARTMSGCSLSGEAELNLALSARRRRYTFGGRSESKSYGREQKGTNIVHTMKRISKGLASLIKSRGQ